MADPDRKASGAMNSAHSELKRINRLLELFLAEGDYFPRLETCNISVRDEDGSYGGYIEVQGWTSFSTTNKGPFSLQSYRSSIRNSQLKQYIEVAHNFIDDPNCAPHVFNQAAMLQRVQEAIADTVDW